MELSQGVLEPQKWDYRRLLLQSFMPRIEPTYVRGCLVSPEIQSAVGLDQFKATLVLCCTVSDHYLIIPWAMPMMPPLLVTVDSTRHILRKAKRTTPYKDLIEYCMLEFLAGDQLQWVVDFFQDIARNRPLSVLVHGDFYALPSKVPCELLRRTYNTDTRYGMPSIRVVASSNCRCLAIAEDVTCWTCVTLPSKRPRKQRKFAVRLRHSGPLLALTLGAPGRTKAA